MSFLEELSKKGLIKESQIGEIKNRAKEKYEGSIDDALLEFGISEDEVLEAKGEYLQIPIKKVNIKYSPFASRTSSSEIPNSRRASSILPSYFSLARFFISPIWLSLIKPFLLSSSKKLILFFLWPWFIAYDW